MINPSSQLLVGVIPRGPSGRALNSSYKSRDCPFSRQELGNSVGEELGFVWGVLRGFRGGFGGDLRGCLSSRQELGKHWGGGIGVFWGVSRGFKGVRKICGIFLGFDVKVVDVVGF